MVFRYFWKNFHPDFLGEVIHFDVRECFKIGFFTTNVGNSSSYHHQEVQADSVQNSMFLGVKTIGFQNEFISSTLSAGLIRLENGRPWKVHIFSDVFKLGNSDLVWRILYKLISRTFMDKQMMYTNEFKEFPNTIHLDFSSVRENEDHASWGMTAQRHVMQWGPVGRPHDTFWCKDVSYRVVFYTHR